MNSEELGYEILKLRKQKGYTQEDLAFKTGLSVRTIQRIESGEVDARNYTIGLLAEALDVTIEYFTKNALGKEQYRMEKENRDRRWLAALHLSGIFVLLIPPLFIYLMKKGEVDGMDEHGVDVLNFQISMWIYLFVLAIPPMIVFGIFIMPLIGLLSTFIVVINSIKVLNNSTYYYPLAIRLIKHKVQTDIQNS